jgi:hypothetical protein
VRHRRTRTGYRPVKNVVAKVSTFLNRLLALRMADQVRPTLAALQPHGTVLTCFPSVCAFAALLFVAC